MNCFLRHRKLNTTQKWSAEFRTVNISSPCPSSWFVWHVDLLKQGLFSKDDLLSWQKNWRTLINHNCTAHTFAKWTPSSENTWWLTPGSHSAASHSPVYNPQVQVYLALYAPFLLLLLKVSGWSHCSKFHQWMLPVCRQIWGLSLPHGWQWWNWGGILEFLLFSLLNESPYEHKSFTKKKSYKHFSQGLCCLE